MRAGTTVVVNSSYYMIQIEELPEIKINTLLPFISSLTEPSPNRIALILLGSKRHFTTNCPKYPVSCNLNLRSREVH